ncbi:tol-pal system protein YbgF [Aquibium sp. A9E412]|uniref:tol-pal system protein YbgF n=1 Tax=Aquibium sp. A9E412 TaxID=2976767 RepID=UPI0025B093D0|nr:tol-pal system protein YbgF [Aquibium sp. A9E412]MDN2565349.1 tol-pal system protein YbgF [Aquibium sp. A9E412]
MITRTVLSGVLALPLLAAVASPAAALRGPADGAHEARAALAAQPDPVRTPRPAAGLPDGSDAPVLLAQAVDPRVTALEEQVRQLNGRIEELNFQILQMQDQMRRMQEDNEFRFQQLEQRSDAGAPAGGEAPPATAAQEGAPAAGDDVAVARGEPERTFGSITFDADGNVVGAAPGDPAPAASAPAEDGAGAAAAPQGSQAADQTTVAALPPTDDPEELYRNAYEFILSGDYRTAEAGFRDHIDRFPGDPRASDAHFWLGEALLGQDRYRDAAEVFLRANREYPDAKKAPDMLLKLGISLAAMNQRDVACATYDEIGKRYPGASDALRERVRQERALAGC